MSVCEYGMRKKRGGGKKGEKNEGKVVDTMINNQPQQHQPQHSTKSETIAT
eukprot:m.17860 g.17860  ORF g.17860 m.17860 type:complete len:51 (+) comp4845_c0_seq1:4126-4278(+)